MTRSLSPVEGSLIPSNMYITTATARIVRTVTGLWQGCEDYEDGAQEDHLVVEENISLEDDNIVMEDLENTNVDVEGKNLADYFYYHSVCILKERI